MYFLDQCNTHYPALPHLGLDDYHNDEHDAVDEVSHVADHMIEVVQRPIGAGASVVQVTPLHVA